MGPTAPFVAAVLDRLRFLLVLTSSTAGNCHSKASTEIAPGVWATLLIVTCWTPVTPRGTRNCECHDLMINLPSEARTNMAMGAFDSEAFVVHCAVRVCAPCVRVSEPPPVTVQVPE